MAVVTDVNSTERKVPRDPMRPNLQRLLHFPQMSDDRVAEIIPQCQSISSDITRLAEHA